MAYIAKRVCSFGGQKFLIGDSVPDNLINPLRAAELIKIGVIAKIPENTQLLTGITTEEVPFNFCVTIHAEEGEVAVPVTCKELQHIFNVLQANAEEAKTIISETNSENVLVILDSVENRKGLKSIIRDRVSLLLQDEEQ